MKYHRPETKPWTLSSMLVLALLLSPAWAYADSTHIATGPVTNWSYGWKSYGTGYFTPFQGRTTWLAGLTAWFDGVQSYPYVAFNNTNRTVTAQITFRAPRNQVVLHPSNDGRLAVVRWTADAAGMYQIQGLFEGLEACGYRNVQIVVNSDIVFNQPLSGTAMATFSLQRSLAIGSTVDFQVDNGGNGYYCDAAGLSALITALYQS